MAVTPIYTNPRFNIRRGYLSGFVGSSNTSAMTFDGTNLQFSYLAPQYVVVLRVRPEFAAASSNTYTLDYVFDMAASQVYLNGNPIAAGVGVKFVGMQTEPTWRIQVLATLPILESVKVDLPQQSGYWHQLWS